MGRYTPSDAERSFLGALMEDGPATKVAAQLEQETADALGVATVSPSILEQLEQQASEVNQGGQPSTGDPQTQLSPAPEQESAATEELMGGVDEEPAALENEAPAPDLPSRLTHGRLFSDKLSHPLQVFDVLNMRYRSDWVDWEPETLWWTLRRDFGPVGDLTRNKIGALRVAATTDAPWLDWDVFENAGLAWNGTVPTVGAFQPMTPAQTAFTVQILREIRDDEPFDMEVKAYIAAILDEYGFVYAPEEYFDGARELLERKQWLTGLRSDVQDAWDRVRSMNPNDIAWNDNNPVDIHVMKLFVVQGYLNEQNARRQEVPGAPAPLSTASPPVPS